MTNATLKNPGYASYVRYESGSSAASWLFETEEEARADLALMLQRNIEQGGTPIVLSEIQTACRTCGGSGSVLTAKAHSRCGGFRGHVSANCYKRCADCR